MAAIRDSIRSFLMAMPFPRAFTNIMPQIVREKIPRLGSKTGNAPLPSKGSPRARTTHPCLAREAFAWKGGSEATAFRLFPKGLGWVGKPNWAIVQEFWRGQNGLHINVKELQAAINTVWSLAKSMELVHLSVDNSVSFAYLSRGEGSPTSIF